VDLNVDGLKKWYHQIQPLDALFFRGSDLVSRSIEYVQDLSVGEGAWTHVGLVVNHTVLPELCTEPQTLYVLEATVHFVGDKDKWSSGVQVRKLREVIQRYVKCTGHGMSQAGSTGMLECPLDARDALLVPLQERKSTRHVSPLPPTKSAFAIGWCPLDAQYRQRLHQKYGDDWAASVAECVLRPLIARHTTYGLHRTFPAAFPCCRQNSDHLHKAFRVAPSGTYFCSELTAEVYQTLGFLPHTVKPAHTVPMDFLGYERDFKGIPETFFKQGQVLLEHIEA